jgi:DNA-binding PadR family transcriptional regulator
MPEIVSDINGPSRPERHGAHDPYTEYLATTKVWYRILQILRRDGPLARSQLTPAISSYDDNWSLVLDKMVEQGVVEVTYSTRTGKQVRIYSLP